MTVASQRVDVLLTTDQALAVVKVSGATLDGLFVLTSSWRNSISARRLRYGIV